MSVVSADFFQRALQLERDCQSFVSITLTGVKGSAPQVVGAKAIVTSDGLTWGTVGGGKIENHCISTAVELLHSELVCQVKEWNLQTDIGMTCGGVVQFMFEVHKPTNAWNIVIFGAGHVTQALAPLLCTLNCKVTVIDDRQEWIQKLPEHDQLTPVLNSNMADKVEQIPENSFVLSITKGHAFDVPVLAKALKRSFPFVGVIGSRVKRMAIEKELLELGLTKKEVHPLVCPIGEKLGNNTPPEIAISIVSQLLLQRDQLNIADFSQSHI